LKKNEPAIIKLAPDVLQVGIAHVLDGEDEAELVLVQAFSNIGEELDCQFFALLVDLRQVDYLCAFGFRHYAGS